ncbi:hypothetical protein TI05_06920 [Achromatium sp. WMS3]|nr:hypothetical protein TI05_06920 [Achromatium sp. WMS3]
MNFLEEFGIIKTMDKDFNILIQNGRFHFDTLHINTNANFQNDLDPYCKDAYNDDPDNKDRYLQ